MKSTDVLSQMLASTLSALASGPHRRLCEWVATRPARPDDVAALLGLERSEARRVVRDLVAARLVRIDGAGRIVAELEALGTLRAYLDRLWLEATLGDAWLAERTAASPSWLPPGLVDDAASGARSADHA